MKGFGFKQGIGSRTEPSFHSSSKASWGKLRGQSWVPRLWPSPQCKGTQQLPGQQGLGLGYNMGILQVSADAMFEGVLGALGEWWLLPWRGGLVGLEWRRWPRDIGGADHSEEEKVEEEEGNGWREFGSHWWRDIEGLVGLCHDLWRIMRRVRVFINGVWEFVVF